MEEDKIRVYRALIRNRLRMEQGILSFIDKKERDILFKHSELGLIVLSDRGIQVIQTRQIFSGMGSLDESEFWAFKEGYEGRRNYFQIQAPSLRAYWKAGVDAREYEQGLVKAQEPAREVSAAVS